jgi:site-specific recombinase XerD
VKNIEDYLEKEKVAALLEHARICNLRDYLMLQILWRTGIRISDLLSIRP